MVKEIPLQNGMVALVDDEDFERVNQHIWFVRASGGGTRLSVCATKAGGIIQLGRFVLQCDDSRIVTFKDGKPLNCSKDNLEVVNKKVAIQKGKGHRDTSSKYKGVGWKKDSNKWSARIYVNGKSKFLGLFEYEDDAAKAYNDAALKYFGEHAFQNVIGEDNSAETFSLDYRKQKQIRNSNDAGFRGITAKAGKWQSQISKDGKNIYLGFFDTAEQAAKAYDRKAYELYGDKAILNFPNEV